MQKAGGAIAGALWISQISALYAEIRGSRWSSGALLREKFFMALNTIAAPAGRGWFAYAYKHNEEHKKNDSLKLI